MQSLVSNKTPMTQLKQTQTLIPLNSIFVSPYKSQVRINPMYPVSIEFEESISLDLNKICMLTTQVYN